MFNKLKQFKELRGQAQQLKTLLAGEKVEISSHGITLIMNGNQEVISLTLPNDATAQQLQQWLPDVINQAITKVQRVMATKIQQSGFKMPQL